MLLEDAGLARAAGLAIDIGQLRELTGYVLEEDAQPQAGGFGGLANSATPLQTLAKPLQNARTPSGATGVPQKGAEASTAILRGFADDTGPAAERIKSLLDRLDAGGDVREEAAKLAEELPSLMPGDPAMAAVLEEAMAEAFAQAAGGATVANSTDANGAEHAEAGSGNGSTMRMSAAEKPCGLLHGRTKSISGASRKGIKMTRHTSSMTGHFPKGEGQSPAIRKELHLTTL